MLDWFLVDEWSKKNRFGFLVIFRPVVQLLRSESYCQLTSSKLISSSSLHLEKA
jgi:hypothetical protein